VGRVAGPTRLGTSAPQDLEGAALLIVDDEESLREMLAILLERAGARVTTAANGQEAIDRLAATRFDTVITDISMPVLDGHAVLRHVRQHAPEVPVIMMTAVAKDLADAVEAIKKGAFDYIQKGFFNNEEFLRRVGNAVLYFRLREENLRLRGQLEDHRRRPIIVGSSPRMTAILSVVERVAPTSSAVLITGESGTGKELVARTIHHNSGRKGRFLTVNCGAFPDELLESELFGHARGAFTGAVSAKRGLFEEADKGTLFLDEVAEMSPAMQVKLLRVLQEGALRPVGTSEERTVDVRIVTATNRDLEEMVREGSFREDLYYRVNVIPIHVPALRERREDIQAMVRHFVAVLSAEMGKDVRQVTPQAMEVLERYAWPGNVRELKNVIERAMALATSDVLDETTLPERVREGRPLPRAAESSSRQSALPEGMRLDDWLDEIRKACIEEALAATGGNQTRAAERLRITFRALRYYVQKYVVRGSSGAGEGAGGGRD
jgi:two-component system response regulator PilR (NtrC family)